MTALRTGPVPRNIEERFWEKVDKSGGPDACWPWTASTRYGYGQFYIGPGTKGGSVRLKLAHRMAWELTNGPIGEGLFVCHKCDNPSCCNPDHYFLGTNLDNVRDCVNKGRNARKLTEEQVREIRAAYPERKQVSLARQYGVSQAIISEIIRGDAWRAA